MSALTTPFIKKNNYSIIEQAQLINSEVIPLNSTLLFNFDCLQEQNFLILILSFIGTIIVTAISTSLICFKLQKWKCLRIRRFKF